MFVDQKTHYCYQFSPNFNKLKIYNPHYVPIAFYAVIWKLILIFVCKYKGSWKDIYER